MDQKSQARDERILEGNKRKCEKFQSGNSSGKGNQRDNSRQPLHNNQRQGNARAMVTAPTDGKLFVKQEEVREVCSGAYAIKDVELKGPNVVIGMFLLNNGYTFVLFNLGSDRSFVDTRFISMLYIDPVKIGASYEVELADGRVVSINTVLKCCTLNLVNCVFEIDLMPIELGTFDVIIGMDWLVKHDAMIVCGGKVLRIPYGNKMVIVESNKGMYRLKVISCIKAHVPVIRDFPKVFLEELPGLPLSRQDKEEHGKHLKKILELLKKKDCTPSSQNKFVRDHNKTTDSSQRPPQDCPKYGNTVDGLYCRHYDDFSCSDDKSYSDEDISKEIYSNHLFDEEIISIMIDPHHFNVKSDLIESLLNQDSLIISSSKINSLLDEFVDELILLKSIPPGIHEADCDHDEEIRLIEKLLYDNSSPRPLEEINSKNYDAIIKSFSPSPIPVEDSDSLMEEINLSLTPDDSMPPGIENDDYDSKGDILILEELLSNDSLSLPENESFHFDIPSSPRPPAKPPDDDEIKPNSGILTVKVVGDISEHYVLMPRSLTTDGYFLTLGLYK
uniref:Reverse transcriptase domain-containing protein n=1 Tax=Tanacetum cinerariifolium TaxID=118510 RepID=A0A6L2LWX0_TANCI|nr:hypothetical protein [Tanacetum cinerariifolium]